MTVYAGGFRPGSWLDRAIRYPMWGGWGNFGEVAAVGSEAGGFQVGDRVVADGRHEAYTLVAVDAPDRPQRVPEAFSDEQACLWSVSRVSLLGVRKAGLALGESVAVLGQGYAEAEAQASHLEAPAMRQAFWEGVPARRALRQAWVIGR